MCSKTFLCFSSTWLNYYKDYFRVMVVHAVYEQRFVLEGLQNDKSFFKRIAQEKPAVFQLHNLISAVRNGRTAPGKKPAPGFVETLRLSRFSLKGSFNTIYFQAFYEKRRL